MVGKYTDQYCLGSSKRCHLYKKNIRRRINCLHYFHCLYSFHIGLCVYVYCYIHGVRVWMEQITPLRPFRCCYSHFCYHRHYVIRVWAASAYLSAFCGREDPCICLGFYMVSQKKVFFEWRSWSVCTMTSPHHFSHWARVEIMISSSSFKVDFLLGHPVVTGTVKCLLEHLWCQ